jgi:glycosyltransferase involved in cell wall biosynthesis
MKRLTAVFSASFLGGSELFNLEFLRRARDLEVEIDAIAPGEGTLAEALRPFVRSLQIVEVPAPLISMSRFDRSVGVYSIPNRFLALRGYSRRLRLALKNVDGPICCLGFRSQLAVSVAGWRLDQPVCWVVHEVVPAGPFAHLWGLAATRVDAIFAYSRAAGWQQALRKTPATVFPVRLDLEPFLELPAPSPPPRVLGLIGDLFPIKNHLGFVDVVRRLRASGQEVEGRIFGRDTSMTNPTAEYVQAVRAATRCNVRLTAVEPGDMPARLAELDLLLHLSTEPESFGRVCVEAMAAGRPVIGFDHGAVAEVIEAERTGVLCPVNDLTAVELAVRRLCREVDLFTRMSEKARSVAREQWGPGQRKPLIGDALAAFAAGQEVKGEP